MEGPEHKGLRAGVDPPFRSRALADGFEAFARPVVRRYVSELRERGAADATRDLYEPISAQIIADMLGLSDVNNATLVRSFQTLNSGMNDDHGDPAVAAETRATVEQIDAYMADMIERLQRDGNDEQRLLGCMVHIGTLDGRPRSFAELIGSIRVIILGGSKSRGTARRRRCSASCKRSAPGRGRDRGSGDLRPARGARRACAGSLRSASASACRATTSRSAAWRSRPEPRSGS